MRRSILLAGLIAAAGLAAPAMSADTEEFHAVLSGFNEVGALNAQSGAIFTAGRGTLELTLDRSAQTLSYKLEYSGLSAAVLQSHIHFGKVHMAGGIMVFFCSNLGNGPAGTPACPATGGTVTGTLTPFSVVGPVAQHVAFGDWDALVAALESHTAYANVHTSNFPAGEIRGEVRRGDGGDD